MRTEIKEKYLRLRGIIKGYDSAVIAFSGGVDSTFLAFVSKGVLRERLLLINAVSSTYPEREEREAEGLAESMGISMEKVETEEVEIEGFADNPENRCYYCKHELFSLLQRTAKEKGYQAVFDGSNCDDSNDYRPGMRAAEELSVVSPLMEADLSKDEIRELSKEFNLPTADKPAYACLASRFQYGQRITEEKLRRVEKAEAGIRGLGFRQFRLRSHENLARLELEPSDMEQGWQEREKINRICREAGFVFVSMDLTGYRTGAMNEALSQNDSLR